jgi:hypothetical protein
MNKNIKVFASWACLAAGFAVLVSGCATGPVKKATKEEASQEVHLKEDRQKLEAIRKDIPPETREFNDETSLILNLFSDQTKTPSEIQSKFYSLTNKKRDEYSKKEHRRRDDYGRDERKRRDKFMENARREREKQKINKMSKEDRAAFFAEQDTERRRNSSDEMDSRRTFEAQVREERQDFDAHMRDMRSRFDSEYKNYYKTYNERKKVETDTKKFETKKSFTAGQPAPPGFTDSDMKDLESIPKSGQPLAPSDSE